MNFHVDFLLSSGISQRRVARYLRINLKTVARKLVYCADQARRERETDQARRVAAGERYSTLQFDELETFERSKCLPLSVPLVVVPSTRKIVGFRVASMPPKGPLAKISRKKYGWRADHRPREVRALFQEIVSLTGPGVRIQTDQNPKYPSWLKPHFTDWVRETTKGRRGSTTGQGELKRVVFDPLFSLNHTCAMLRANINRLMRKTWCTTKRPDRLAAHLELYVRFHNSALTS